MAEIQELFDEISEFGCEQSKHCTTVKKWGHQEQYSAQFNFNTLDDPIGQAVISASGGSMEEALANLLALLEEKIIRED